MIRLVDVHKRYRTAHGIGPWVLQGVNLEIPANTSVGLVGRNGAGKSTLLRLIGGTDTPTRGQVHRDVSVSFPLGLAGGLQGSLTGRQNTKFVIRLFGCQHREQQILDAVCEYAELGRSFDEPVRGYSSGMQGRLRFAISLAFDFDIYLVDEVTAVGDAVFRRKSRETFRQLAGQAGIIMVSHDEKTLKEFCQCGIWLHQGRAHWFDNIDDALRCYKESIKA